jgi:hypothetical protein
VHPPFELNLELGQLGTQPLRDRDAQPFEPSPSGRRTDVDEPQEGERFWSASTAPASSRRGEPAELDQAGFVLCQLQPELRQPLTKVTQELLRIRFVFEAHDKVVGEPDDDDIAIGVRRRQS